MNVKLAQQIDNLLGSKGDTDKNFEAIAKAVYGARAEAKTIGELQETVCTLDVVAGRMAGLGIPQIAKIFREMRDAARLQSDLIYTNHLAKNNRHSEIEKMNEENRLFEEIISFRDQLSDVLEIDPSRPQLSFAAAVGKFTSACAVIMKDEHKFWLKFKNANPELVELMQTKFPQTADSIKTLFRQKIADFGGQDGRRNSHEIAVEFKKLPLHIQKFVASPTEIQNVEKALVEFEKKRA